MNIRQPEPATIRTLSPARIASIDAYRGAVILLMMSEAMAFAQVAESFPGNWFWSTLAHNQTHVEWDGASLWDLIQPSFSFLVGVALPFSLAKRAASGQPHATQTLHAFTRAGILVALGLLLRAIETPETRWTFEDTLTQIGLGYGILYLLALRPRKIQWAALVLVLAGYWLAFALYPLPVGDEKGWPFTGFAAHWNKNTNFAWAFDTWFLNLFPRATPFTSNSDGYVTLSFIPTLGTMIMGLLAGGVLADARQPTAKVSWLAIVGVASLLAGWLLGASGLAPVVKRIWTPSWTLYSGGWCLLILAGCYLVIDVWQERKYVLFLTIVGMNSITGYFFDSVRQILPRYVDLSVLPLEPPYGTLMAGAAVVLLEWWALWWMYRRRIFVRL